MQDLGVELVQIPIFEKGPQPQPAVIDDRVRGRVNFLSVGQEPFCAVFDMKVGQMRGQAYHREGNVVFHILRGSYVFMTSDEAVQKVEVRRVDEVCQIHVPPGRSHVFIPLTDGQIMETADIATEQFLGNIVRVNDLFKPYIEKAQADIAAGKYRAYGRAGLPKDII